MKEKKDKKYGLLKGILLFIGIAFILSWLIPNGEYQTDFVDLGMNRLGFENLALMMYHTIYYSIDKISLLLVIGGLYGVLSKTGGYERLVSGIAKKVKHKKVFVVVISVVISLLASLIQQGYALLIFIPFIIAIFKRMKVDKITTLAATFGALLIGIMGATYGSEGIMYLNPYLSQIAPNIFKDTMLIRAGILGVGLVLFNFFIIWNMRKNNDKEIECSEMFEIEAPKENKGNTIIPIVVLGILMLVLVILGYVDWSGNFGIEIFNDFHEKLVGVELGKGFFIFKDLLGTEIEAFGAWQIIFPIVAVVMVFTVIIALCYKVKFDDFITNYINGLKKVLKPIACVLAAWALLVVVYMSPYVGTIINKLLSLTDGFNLATMTISAFILDVFHTDIGFTGYKFASFFGANYADYLNQIYIILISLYGFVQLFIPTSALLGIGITSLDVKYKDWLKYIWRFLLGMLICLLVIFILITIF